MLYLHREPPPTERVRSRNNKGSGRGDNIFLEGDLAHRKFIFEILKSVSVNGEDT